MSRWAVIAATSAVAIAILLVISSIGMAPAPAEGPEAEESSDEVGADAGVLPAFLEDRQATGTHWRFESSRGPVHVWMPPGYRHPTAGIVFYVHGYYIDVDGAWTEHDLAEQFRKSGRNALFIAPEAPARKYHKVRWRDPGHLIREVRTRLNIPRPWGPVVAVGHSGAYRTLIPWLSYRPLQRVIMLDALYGHEHPFRHWLEEVRGSPNRLTMVTIDTLRWSEPFAQEIDYTRAVDWIPRNPAPEDALGSNRFLYIRSQYNHMGLVTRGEAIPALLQMTDLEPVAE